MHKCYVFPMICVSGGSKSRLAKAAGAESCGQRRNEKLHAAVARSTFASQNVQNRPCSEKVARRCGAKRIFKSKCTNKRAFWSIFGGSDVEKVSDRWHR